VNAVDLLVIGLAFVTGTAGWRLGLINRALSWVFMMLAVLAAALMLPTMLDLFSDVRQNWLVAGAVLVLAAAALAGQSVGMLLGSRVAVKIRSKQARRLDKVGGAAFGASGLVIMVWLITPAVLAVPGWLADQTSDSPTVSLIHRVLPNAPDTFEALQSIVGTDSFPQIFNDVTPAVEVGDPPSELQLDAGVEARVGAAVVRLEAIACGHRQDGTGFFIGPGQILTNAHVVAGSQRVSVALEAGQTPVPATVVAYDPNRDLAVLRVHDDGRAALVIGEAVEGDVVAVFGHPQGGGLRATPAQLAERVLARGRDLYNDIDIQRRVYFMAAALEPGDSGGPVVDSAGRLVAVTFAIAPDDPGIAFALISEEVTDFLVESNVDLESSTGDCI
jgi:S1-C subfamily serine protease